MKLINRSVGILLLTAACAARGIAAPDAVAPRIVVMISIDGLAAQYVDDPKAEMTTLRALAAEGARASMMKASTPTVTWPNHTTLVTGDNPAKHGVLGNNYFDRATGKKVVLISDPVYDKDQIVKVPTIYDVAKAAGMKTAAIRWPATRGATNLDWTVPDVRSMAIREKYSTPSLAAQSEKAGLAWPGKKEEPESAGEQSIHIDETWTKIFNLILRENKPNLALLHIINVDHTEHEFGPKSPEAYAAVKASDDQVKMVWDELKKDYPGTATLIVVSDHGFSLIKKQILPNIILKNAKLGSKKSVQLVSQGGSEFVYILDSEKREELSKELRATFKKVDGISKVVGSEDFAKYGVADPQNDPHVPDLILFAADGYSFGDTANGSLPFVEKPERKGSHGHDSSLPNLHATFVAWGDGIKPGVKLGEISNIDVAPTIAKLLNLNLPDTDGKPLDKILTK